MKTCLISGASQGIGESLAYLFAKTGYNVLLLARDGLKLETICSEINSGEGSAHFLPIDLTNAEEVLQKLPSFLDQFQPVNVLINNAGCGIFGPMEDFSLADYDRVMDLNLKASFLLTSLVLKGMKEERSGHVIAVASDVSKRTFARGSLYCASKYAQDALFSALRKEVRPFGIKVSVVYPGLTDTAFHPVKEPESVTKQWLTADQVAQAVLFIAEAPDQVVIDELMIHPLSQDY